MNESIVHLNLRLGIYIFQGQWETAAHTKKFLRQILSNDSTKSVYHTGGIDMEQEITLDIRDVTKAYLDANRWNISDMACLTNIPRSTLSEWFMRCVRDFLNGNYIKEASTVRSNLSIQRGTDNEH